MPEELFSEQTEEKLDWAKYWATAVRRRWYFILPFFAAWAVVWSVSWLLPAVYRSSTLILVERPAASAVVPSSMSQDIQSRLDSINQQVLSRTHLLHIITDLNVYSEERSRGKTDDELVELMRKNIEIELVRSSDRELTAFNIYFSASNPYMAQQVTTELTNVLISENLETTSEGLKNVTKFLDTQMDEARKKLAVQEEQVRIFKDRHIGELPTQLQSNLQILAGQQAQLQAEQDALGRAQQQKTYLESLIAQYSDATRVSKSGDAGAVGLPALEQELTRLRAQLADLSARYTDQHPDVRKVKEQIAKAEKMQQQLTAEIKNQPSTQGSDSPSIRETGPMMEVRSQLKANQIEIANRQRAIDNLQAQIGSYQARLNSTPVREQELADLTRDYDQSRANYESLLAKRNQAQLAENLATQQQGEHFRVMDPPSFPSKPFSPNRFKLSFLGLFAGLAFGLVVAGGAEFLDDRIYNEEEFKKLVAVEVMAEIPRLSTSQEETDNKRKFWFGMSAVAGMAVIILAGIAVSFLHG